MTFKGWWKTFQPFSNSLEPEDVRDMERAWNAAFAEAMKQALECVRLNKRRQQIVNAIEEKMK